MKNPRRFVRGFFVYGDVVANLDLERFRVDVVITGAVECFRNNLVTRGRFAVNLIRAGSQVVVTDLNSEFAVQRIDFSRNASVIRVGNVVKVISFDLAAHCVEQLRVECKLVTVAAADVFEFGVVEDFVAR